MVSNGVILNKYFNLPVIENELIISLSQSEKEEQIADCKYYVK